MTKIITNHILTVLIVLILFTSCSKNDSNDTPQKQTVTYEITGNFSKTLNAYTTFTTTTNETEDQNFMITSLPWSKTIEYPNNTIVVGLGIGSVELVSIPGESVTIKIKVNGVTTEERSTTVGADELLPIISISHSFL